MLQEVRLCTRRALAQADVHAHLRGTGEEAPAGRAGEVVHFRDGAVVLAQRLVQLHADPVPLRELDGRGGEAHDSPEAGVGGRRRTYHHARAHPDGERVREGVGRSAGRGDRASAAARTAGSRGARSPAAAGCPLPRLPLRASLRGRGCLRGG